MVRKIIAGLVLLIGGYASWLAYGYYFDAVGPEISLAGIEDGKYYTRTVPCELRASDRCKIKEISAWLDDKPITVNENVGSSSYSRSFDVVTPRLSNGLHFFKIEATDGSRKHNKTFKNIVFYVDNAELKAGLSVPTSDLIVYQGRTLHIPIQINKNVKKVTVSALSKEFCACCNERSTVYDCYIPIEYEEIPGQYPFNVSIEDHIGNSCALSGSFRVEPYVFKKQVLHKIDNEKFEEERKLGKNEQECAAMLIDVTRKSPAIKRWRGPFYAPINITATTCDFGVRGISQARGCYTHNGLDVVGCMPNTAVWAPQDGVVAIKERFGVNGNMVVIDHGCGVLTLLGHLDHFANINVGDTIRRGSPIGVTGRTGFASGDHLHWEMRVQNIPVDPLQWTKLDF